MEFFGIFLDFSKFIFEFILFKIKFQLFLRADVANDAAKCRHVTACALAIWGTCVTRCLCMCSRVRACMFSGLSILFKIYANPLKHSSRLYNR